MNPRERFLAACACRPLERPPLWIMRQAGRYLPEYRELKAKHGFLAMVRTPELAVEASLQPVRRFAFDAAILFCDILVIPEALGLGYTFRDEGGIAMEGRIEGRASVEALGNEDAVPGRLSYVAEALALLKRELAGSRAVLGFGGSPWTLATYMVEGGSSADFARIKSLFHGDRATFDLLLGKLTRALVAYFRMQIASGADAIQIFDTWGGIVAGPDYEAASLRWIRSIVAEMPAGVPDHNLRQGDGSPPGGPGPDRRARPQRGQLERPRQCPPRPAGRRGRPGKPRPGHPEHDAGGSAPGDPPAPGVDAQVDGHIFNLGHGILPQAKIECVEALVEAVTSWR